AGPSPDELVRSDEEGLWDGKSKGLSGLEVDDELELGGLLDREISGLGPFENLVYVDGRPPHSVGDAWPIRQETARLGELTQPAHHRQPAPDRVVRNSCSVKNKHRVPENDDGARPFRDNRIEGTVDPAGVSCLQHLEPYRQCAGPVLRAS